MIASTKIGIVWPLYSAIAPPDDTSNARVRAWAQEGNSNREWRLLKASALFFNPWERDYPWYLAMQEACEMKSFETAREMGKSAPRVVSEEST